MRIQPAHAFGLVGAVIACGPGPGGSMVSGTGETSATAETAGASVATTSTGESSLTRETSSISQGDSETTWGSPECPDVYEGNLEIGPDTDVDAYRFTSHVTGYLSVSATTLENLDFLSCLERVDHGIVIRSNAALTSLAGLERLESVGPPDVLESWLLVSQNPVLGDLDAVSSLREAFLVQVSGNASLVSLGLGGLESLEILNLGYCDPQDDDVDKANNASLTTINGLASLVALREVEIGSQKNLTSLGRLHELALAGAFTGRDGDYAGNFWQNEMLPIEQIEALSMASGRLFVTCENLNDANTECTCPPPD